MRMRNVNLGDYVVGFGVCVCVVLSMYLRIPIEWNVCKCVTFVRCEFRSESALLYYNMRYTCETSV